MKKFVVCLLALLAVMVYADRIELSDGSVINGKIKSISGGVVEIATAFAGNIKVEQNAVIRLDTAESVNVVKADGSRFSGCVKGQGDNGAQAQDIKYLWTDDMADPTLPQGRVWSGEVAADITGKTGNSEKFNSAFSVTAELKGPVDVFTAMAMMQYDREEHATTTEKYLATLDYERMLPGDRDLSWYVKAEFEKQPTSGLKLRGTAAAGIGLFFLKNDRTTLRGRAGLAVNHKKYESGSSSDSIGADLELRFEQKIQDWGKWVTLLAWQPAFDDIHDYRLLHESSLDIPLLFQYPLALRLGVQNEYNSKVDSGREHLDTTYFAKLVFKWK